MRLKIVSDGISINTSVVNADTGERIDGVTCIKWFIDNEGCSKAVIELEFVKVDIIGEVK